MKLNIEICDLNREFRVIIKIYSISIMKFLGLKEYIENLYISIYDNDLHGFNKQKKNYLSTVIALTII